MATYNGARYLAGQLQSILAGTMLPDEIVISDDGSSDETLEIVRQIASASPVPITLLTPAERRGPSGNFERALEATTGQIIALCDQDDLWHVDRLERAVEAFRGRGALLQHADARLVDRDGAPLGSTLLTTLSVSSAERAALASGRAFAALLRRNLVTGATVILDRNLLPLALPVPPGWLHDEWLAIVAAAHDSTQLLPQAVIDYRQHGANEVGVTRRTPRVIVRRFTESRKPRVDRLLMRAESLESRAVEGRLPATKVEAIRAKAQFERTRAAYPARRIGRILPVIAGLTSGNYRRFASQGKWDALRDLVQAE